MTNTFITSLIEALQCSAILLTIRAYLFSFSERQSSSKPLLSGAALAFITGLALGFFPGLTGRPPSQEAWTFFRQLTEISTLYIGLFLIVLRPRGAAPAMAGAGLFLLGCSISFFEARSLSSMIIGTDTFKENPSGILASGAGGLVLGFLPLMLVWKSLGGLSIIRALNAGTLLIGVGALRLAFGGIAGSEDESTVTAVFRGVSSFLENAQAHVRSGLFLSGHRFMAVPLPGLTDRLFGQHAAAALTSVVVTAPPLAALIEISGRLKPARRKRNEHVALLRPIAFLYSWWLTAALLLGLLASYLYFTFGTHPYAKWLEFVYKTPEGLFLYGALAANLLLASVRAVFVKLAGESIAPDTIEAMDNRVELPLTGSDTMGSVARAAEKAGYGMEIIGASASSRKGKYSFLPGTILRAGIIVLMVSAALSLNLRKTDRAIFYEGGERELMGRLFRLEKIDPNLPEEFLQSDEISPFRIGNVSASVTVSGKTYSITSAFPRKADDLHLRLTHLGYMQPISGRTPTTVFDWDAFLDVLPPGKTDSEILLSNTLSLAFTLAPTDTLQEGTASEKRYKLRGPSYSLAIINTLTGERSESVHANPSESAKVGDVDITLGKNSFYVQLQAVNDPALSWMYFGLYLLLAGAAAMPARLFWYEEKLYAFRTYEAVLVGHSQEFYKRRGAVNFGKLAEELRGRSSQAPSNLQSP